MKKKIILVILLALGAYIFNTLKNAGVFLTIGNNFKGTVEVLNSPVGVEDITINHETGEAFLSSHNRRNKETNGAIYLLKLNDSTVNYINLTQKLPFKDFRPHGISLFQTPDKRNLLFAINHRPEGDFVEEFEYKNDSLVHLQSFTNPLFESLNDLLATGEHTFYVSNDHSKNKGIWRTMTDFLKIPTGYVVYFDGKNAKQVSDKIAYANGVNWSKDHKTVFVASTLNNEIYVYNRQENGDLTKIYTKELGIGPDNIEVDTEGMIWVACHPQPLKFLGHAKSAEKHSPSAILKLIYIPEADYKFLQEGIYSNDGSQLSGSSVAAYYERDRSKNDSDLLVGSVFENKILRLHRDYSK